MIKILEKGAGVDGKTGDGEARRGLKEDVFRLCEELGKDPAEFEDKDFYSKLYQFIDDNKRLLYTVITDYVFQQAESGNIESVTNNIEMVRDYAQNVNAEDGMGGMYKKDVLRKTNIVSLKLWDHINLATRQYGQFHKDDAEYLEIVEGKLEPVKAEITKDMTQQLISIVAIFTAMSFLAFGGVSALDNILDGATNMPLLKLTAVGLIWCFCMFNMLFVFVYFVSKIIGIDIGADNNFPVLRFIRYPAVALVNAAILIASILCGIALKCNK